MFSQKEILEFGDWCRNGLTNVEYSSLNNNNQLLEEWRKRNCPIEIRSRELENKLKSK
ncbi:MAG: hypothetical protein ABJN84_18285 [Flavobacteriaceae bacterium]